MSAVTDLFAWHADRAETKAREAAGTPDAYTTMAAFVRTAQARNAADRARRAAATQDLATARKQGRDGQTRA